MIRGLIKMTLKDIKTGGSATIISVDGEGALRQHFLDMGVIPGTVLTVEKLAPMGDPMEIRLRGYELTLRTADADLITVERTETPEKNKEKVYGEKKQYSEKSLHPGFGEFGHSHPEENIEPLSDDTILTFALVGNQNCGKTTLFNQLTGSNQHVGNFPGVTVDRKDGAIRNEKNTLITDLPGIYSMSPYSGEELVSRDFVLREKPKAIINIIDVTNIERNLYLTMQLLEMNIPTVVALNMMDELIGNGGTIDINRMEDMLGVPVIPISAAKNEGVDELVDHALHIAHFQERPMRQDFCSKDVRGGAVHQCLHAVMHLIEDHAARVALPVRFAASKVVEGDPLILSQLELDQNEIETIEHIVLQMEKECGLDRAAAIADMRFSFIENVCASCVKKPEETKEHIRSRRIDSILTGRFTAIPVFILIMGLVFFLTFNVIGAFLQEKLDILIGMLSDATDSALTAWGVNPMIHSLIIGGIFEGVGGVLSFLPIIVTMFFFLSLLEDSGYIARVAFFMDKLLRKIGLSGRSIVPMLIGFGCSVPAIMSTRTLPSDRDRWMTIFLTPFMSCSAKLPIYAFFVSAFFPKQGGLIMIGLYLFGILMGIIFALISKSTVFKGEAVPFVMELPNYRLPSTKSVGLLIWEKSKDFLSRAFSIILIATIVIWFLKSFDLHFNLLDEEASRNSILAVLSGVIAPVFAPLGLNDWRIATSLICGFIAKESVVSTIEVLYPAGVLSDYLTPLGAVTFLVFSLLYTPCVAAIAAISRELGKKWGFFVALWQCAIAWVIAFAVRWIGMLMGF